MAEFEGRPLYRMIMELREDFPEMPRGYNAWGVASWLADELKKTRAQLAGYSRHDSKAQASAADGDPADPIDTVDPFAARLRQMPPGSRIILERAARHE